jgi:hypothetical protein
MTTRYRTRQGLAWVEAHEGGQADRVVWIADVATGERVRLEGSSWLVWVLIADGATDADEIRAAAAEIDAAHAFDGFDLSSFLDSLVARGLLQRFDPETPAT